MKKYKVAVLGAHGMLGSMVLSVLGEDDNFSLIGTVRKAAEIKTMRRKYPQVEIRVLDLDHADIPTLKKAIAGADWVINCIGILKPYISEDDPFKIERAIRINALYPQHLAQAALKTKAKVIQIETDCVFSGVRGNYKESDPHDPLDVYGKTKSLGETYYPNVIHLRCSIIGPEPRAHVSLLDWFLTQKPHAQVNGFTNHHWNGVTTYQFARLCQGIVKKNPRLPRVQHVVPQNKIDKASLLEVAKVAFHREDLKIKPVKASVIVNRTLQTENPAVNQKLWRAAGYKNLPTVREMILELGQFYDTHQ